MLLSMRTRRGIAVGVAAAVVTAFTAASCGEESAPAESSTSEAEEQPETVDVYGTLTLTDRSAVNYALNGTKGEECWGEDGYDDIAGGAQVVIRDSDGTKVGLGELDTGALTEDSDRFYAAPCLFPFAVTDVPAGDDAGAVYSVEVAHRGEVSFSLGDMVELTLG